MKPSVVSAALEVAGTVCIVAAVGYLAGVGWALLSAGIVAVLYGIALTR